MDLGRPESIPVFGFALPTLAIIVALTTYIQSKLTMPATSTGGDQSAMMGNMMSIYMPLLLGYFALTFASGLSVYFITSNLLGIVQYGTMGKANWRNLLPGGNKVAKSTKTK
jgi:YidC/Oxa1 family membrane protein insertase